MKTLFLYLPSFSLTFILALPAQANLGHRLWGGDVYQPENTLYCFGLALQNLVDKREFTSAELDIIESKDGVPMVFHDMDTIKRIVPKSFHNLQVLKRVLEKKPFAEIKIADLTTVEIQKLILMNHAQIPTLKEVLNMAVKWNFKKRIVIDN